ncbi:uncharacterized protein T551_00984 [Pneumocystis jirovecii RU7]|uniref:Ubiquitin-like domain-containing protein n=1 Tax=Pneumocystis jirovecii (strain RU7) TaxID=1408657 RepID=A0A0W4ZTK9_PNEJ7|nr:uncharacterized protein T551_00984 [Pneumocystis jirovecii RU7]KTW31723.1 hypothetical protein T551_00984 [Pneumocystis jirovecii RU7]
MYDIDNSDGHMPCKIKVRVKSSMIPHLSEFVFEVNRQLTVGVLKNWISAVFKDYVSISEQQLLSGDCIAKNSQEISQFIKDDPNSVTFHLTTASESSLLSLSVPGLFIPFNVLGCDSFSQDIPGLGKTEQNTLDETVKSCSGSCDCTWLPIYYQAAVVNNELCLLKILNHSNVCSLDKESFSTEKRSPYRVLLMSSENVVQHINQNVQNNSQFLNTAVDSDSHVQNPGINNERLRMIFVHLWLFIRLAFFVGLFSVNSSWIRFCTLVIIALQFFLVWHTGRLLSIRLFFQRIINRDRDRNSHRNEQSSLGSEPELSQSISHDQGHNQNTEFNWGRNLGYREQLFMLFFTELIQI